MLLLSALALVAAPQLGALQPRATAPVCPPTTSYYAAQPGKTLKPRKLTELPDANAYSAVYRRIDGCELPIVVKYRVGGR